MPYYEYDKNHSAQENIAIGLLSIANELRRIGLNNAIDSSAPGALEALAINVESASSSISTAIETLADAVASINDATTKG